MHQQTFLSRDHQWGRWKRATSALLFAGVVGLLAILGVKFTSGHESLHFITRGCVMLGGRFMAGGYIQFCTFFAFFWAILETLYFKKEFDITYAAPMLNILNKSEKSLSAVELRNIETQTINFEKQNGKSLLSDLIKKACHKYKLQPSVSEVMEVINVQIEIYKEKAFSAQNIIRYLNFAIPSLGFIGTVIGLSDAMMIAHTGDMERIAIGLGTAFDTTLIALVLGLILMWHMQELEELTDLYHAETKELLFSHLVPRLGSAHVPEA
ncbi:MAG: hypothetical protein A2X86_02475 [Bdellovibrionales bacterium GWA2_49_15]|nr:MAG: hypothetical protein A2X86_02475 [Bdellovibrionales bacterium GWA2_49_15]